MNPNEGLYRPDLPIPKGWRRVKLGEKTKVGDRVNHNFVNTEFLSSWTVLNPYATGFAVVKGNFPVIREEPVDSKKEEEIHRPEISDESIPEGWYRLDLGTVLEKGDRFYHFHELDPRPSCVGDWNPVLGWDIRNKTRVVPEGAVCIRKISENPVQNNNGVVFAAANKIKEEEKRPMNKINSSTLTALLVLRAGEPTETLPGCEGEGVFAQALKDAELKRRETALKALTEVAIEIQDAFATAKEAQRAEIRRAQAVIEKAKTRLNVLDAAAEPLKSTNPNPFPLLNELGMVTRHELGLSAEEFAKLVAVPTKN